MKQMILAAVAVMSVVVMSACGGTSTCNSSNCSTGCCSASGTCETGDTASACGTGGAACDTCTNGSCNANKVCAGVDPESTWKVQPASATIKNNNNGAKWDSDDSAPDAKVLLFCPQSASDTTSETNTADDTYEPTWSTGGCVLKASALLSGGFAYQVVDSDVLGATEPITQKINVTVVEADLTAGVSKAVPSDGLTALRISLQKQ